MIKVVFAPVIYLPGSSRQRIGSKSRSELIIHYGLRCKFPSIFIIKNSISQIVYDIFKTDIPPAPLLICSNFAVKRLPRNLAEPSLQDDGHDTIRAKTLVVVVIRTFTKLVT